MVSLLPDNPARDISVVPVITDLAATIIYDMQRAGVKLDKIQDYKNRMFRGSVSLKAIGEHVERRGRFIYKTFQEGYGRIEPVHVPHDTPIKIIDE